MTEGIFSLVGVLVGGAITLLTTIWLDRVRERTGLTAAARLIYLELAEASTAVAWVTKNSERQHDQAWELIFDTLSQWRGHS